VIAFLKLIRLPNLLIIAFTQYMIRFCLIQPVLTLSGFELQMQEWEFALLVLATLFIASGGYIINDYFDVRIDNINKPDDMVIDKGVKRRVAMGAHAVLSMLGCLIGIYLSWKSNILLAGATVFCLSVVGLWYYSTTFKHQLLIGNFIVSFFTSIAVILPALFEVPRIIAAYNSQLLTQQLQFGSEVTTTKILMWTATVGVFAFILSLIREMIKDMEDMEGDAEYGCRTIPIVLGVSKTKIIVLSLIGLTMAGCGYIQFLLHYLLNEKFSDFYFALLIHLPLLALFFLVLKAKTKQHFHGSSMFVKFIMLTGVCFLILLQFLLLK